MDKTNTTQLNSYKILDDLLYNTLQCPNKQWYFWNHHTQKTPKQNMYEQLKQDNEVPNTNASPVDRCCTPAEF